MYGVGNGMFESRYNQQATGNRQLATGSRDSFDQGTAAYVTPNALHGMRGCTQGGQTSLSSKLILKTLTKL